MTTEALPDNGLSIRGFLLSGDKDDISGLREELSKHGFLGSCGDLVARLTTKAKRAVEDELASITAGLTDIDLSDTLIAGWQKVQRVLEAARATLATPGSEELVQLDSHRVTAVYEPTVDLLIDGLLIHTFHAKIDVVIDVEIAVLVIRGGCLTEVRCGDTEVECVLTLEKAKLLSKKGRVELLPHIHFATGIKLPVLGQAGQVDDSADVSVEEETDDSVGKGIDDSAGEEAGGGAEQGPATPAGPA